MTMTKKEKQFLTEYIKLYRSFPCLWKIKSKEYNDRNVKSQTYEIIIEKMQEFDQNLYLLWCLWANKKFSIYNHCNVSAAVCHIRNLFLLKTDSHLKL
ncbi:hypothetical protein RN001_016380 [Aquatica leii]|uniref:MADF domain-containing protein n=1 Tax=Aquatica leii TaxID=1421715 RepID=A0AAN7P1N8_9COLE|nr:hypothetical protein RN001_016380 [Aquatica leii]